MNIVIAGAGELGSYIANILSKEEHNVILIENDVARSEAVQEQSDISVRHGSATDWQLLEELFELDPSLFIAVTDKDEVNLVSSAIAKQLGYPRTIARVKDARFLNRTRLDFGRIFEVDYFICGELLVAQDILKYLMTPGSVLVENFAHGAVQLRTLVVPDKFKKQNIPLSELRLPENVIVGLIEREVKERQSGLSVGSKKVIFPHGSDFILPGDEVTLIGERGAISEIHHFFGISSKSIQSIAIAGASESAIYLGKLLQEQNIDVLIIDKSKEKCEKAANLLPDAAIIHHDATDISFLKAEKIGSQDVFASLTHSDEINLMVSLLAREIGCNNVIAMFANTSYSALASELGINHIVSPKISASNHILSKILSGTVRSLVSLYENQAEIMEVNVSIDSPIIGIPLSELGPLLPSDFLIAMIQNRGRIMIANGNRIISAGDTVIVITSPKHIGEIEKIF